jgi:hypothetical protein
MPFCPKCKSEYRPGVARCRDCGAALVEALPPEPWQPTPETELAVLCRGVEPGEAEVMREVLAQAGIACSVRTFGPITGDLARVADGVTHDACTILVTRNRLKEAERVLEEARSARVEWPEGMEPSES